MKVFISDAAENDLLHIIRYLSDNNTAAAGRLARDINEKFTDLAQFPFIGRERSSLGDGLRSVVAGMHVIFYEVQHERIVIVRVLDGRRDIDAEFQR